MLKFKSVYDSIDRNDGLRILATRFRGHGMKKDRYDVWMPNLGPSERILKGMLADEISWGDFAREYRNEVLSSGEIDGKNRTIMNHGQKFTLRLIRELAERGNVTVMCHCATGEKHCHLRILEKILERV